ncbi:MAG TPA: hypothetical protein VGG99_12760 [Acetobacteraceae bacterium]|jgi:hypothetical protein
MQDAGLTLLLIARIPPNGVAAFQEYEARVLPILAAHGGVLQRRLRSADQQIEVHVVWFPSAAQFDAYRNDPRRTEHAALLERSGASSELLRLDDVTD